MKYTRFKEKATQYGCKVVVNKSNSTLASIDVYLPHSNFRHYSISLNECGKVNILTRMAFNYNSEIIRKMNNLVISLANTLPANRGNIDAITNE